MKLAAQLNYAPNLLARNLTGATTNIIGCLILEFTNPFFVPMVRAIEDIAERRDYIIFLGESRRQLSIEKYLVERFRRIRAVGVIATPTMEGLQHLEILLREHVPVVIVGRNNPGFDSINVDNYKSGYLVGEYLAHLGHRKIGFVYSGDPINTPETARLEGFQAYLGPLGIQVDYLFRVGNNRQAGGELGAALWMSNRNRPTAVFCSNDLLAMGFIHKLIEKGVRIPGDVSVVGHDDIPFAEMFKVALTTIAFPKYEMGSIAMDILINRIGKPEWDAPSKNIVLEPELVIRDSCAPAENREMVSSP
jgi:DNA-binding LacI/PurR family transcriptional regulator